LTVLSRINAFLAKISFNGLELLARIFFSLNPNYGNICGYTQKDIETSFKEYLKDANLEDVRKWYNGYNFLGESVYNPFDILLFIRNNLIFRNYWFETGTPTYLIKLLKEKNYFIPQLENLVVGEEIINSFDIEEIKLETLLFQTGYLTIKKQIIDEFEFIEYHLGVPNKEIQKSLNLLFFRELTDITDYLSIQKAILKAMV
jgi:hypothetical protein